MAEMIPPKLDTWESMVDVGITLAQAQDRNRWAMGDLAQRAERSYGDGSLSKLAYAINLRAKTFYEYHRVYAFYGESNSTHVENVTWSHHREAMRLGDLDKALWALNKASDKDWRVEKFNAVLSRYLGKGKRSQADAEPKRLLDTSAIVCRQYQQDDGDYLVLRLPRGCNGVNYSANRHVRLVIMENAA